MAEASTRPARARPLLCCGCRQADELKLICGKHAHVIVYGTSDSQNRSRTPHCGVSPSWAVWMTKAKRFKFYANHIRLRHIHSIRTSAVVLFHRWHLCSLLWRIISSPEGQRTFGCDSACTMNTTHSHLSGKGAVISIISTQVFLSSCCVCVLWRVKKLPCSHYLILCFTKRLLK